MAGRQFAPDCDRTKQAMTEPILIGVRGWEYPPQESYYPPELPEEWRFCFYSNRLRSVLVPAQVWAESGSAPAVA